jgi:hypothetical protein
MVLWDIELRYGCIADLRQKYSNSNYNPILVISVTSSIYSI